MPGKPGPKPKRRVTILNLSPEKLREWPSDSTPRPEPSATPQKDSSKDVTPAADAPVKESTPAAATPGANLEVPQRKKPGPPKGTKRKIDALLPDGTPKPRGKPGPKKRKLDADGSTQPWTTPAGPAAHKLGPKANQGAINAGLRALDRTGKPCRKWQKKSFTLKSFTGQVWTLPCWSAPKKPVVIQPDEEGEGEGEGETGENKENATASNSDAGINTPGLGGGPGSDAGASVVDATPKEGSAVPVNMSSPAPTGTATPMEIGA